MNANRNGIKEKEIYKGVMIGVIMLILVIVFLNRVIRGVDTTDESYYSTMAYRLCNGSTFISDTWEQHITSAVLPSVLLSIYKRLLGGVDGCILFFRIVYFAFNVALSCFVTFVLSHFVKPKYALFVASLFLFYAPFHLYNLSYNNQADYLMLLCEMFLVFAAVKTDNAKKGNRGAFICAGIACACLAFCYPPMLFLCPIMVLLLFLKRKETENGYRYFTLGGIATAIVMLLILFFSVGFGNLLSGVNGILSDPIYGTASGSYLGRIYRVFNHLFVAISEGSKVPMKIYALLVAYVIYHRDKYPKMRIVVVLYPIIVWLQMYPSSSLGTIAAGTFAFYLSLFAPLLLFFIDDQYKHNYMLLLYYVWIPSLFLYTIFSSFSAGGPESGNQGFVAGGMVTLVGIVYVIQGYVGDTKNEKILKEIITSVVLVMTLVLEISVYYSVVYRDTDVSQLTSKVEYGPYKGLYTTNTRREYLENMTNIMHELENGEEKALVLYHSNFAYLMLSATPVTPLTWGVYPHISNESVFMRYFGKGKEHIPDAIYIVDVPNEWNYECQREEYYGFCVDLKKLIEDYYTLDEHLIVNETGKVDKYSLKTNKQTIEEELQRYSGKYLWGEGFYGEERNENAIFSWCKSEGTIILPNDMENEVKVHVTFFLVAPAAEIGASSVSFQIGDVRESRTFHGIEEIVSLETVLKPGENLLKISSDTPQYVVKEDSRELYYYVANIKIDEIQEK